MNKKLIKIAREAVNALYSLPNGCVGGSCHIATDDFNLEDRHLDMCEKWANEDRSKNGEEQYCAEIACIVALRKLSAEERLAVFGLTLKELEEMTSD